MKITPLDIRKQSFERVFRGYDKDAVDAYLTSLSQEWERLLDENRLLNERIERTESDFSKLKALENTLYKTLQTAQTTSQEMALKAQQESEQHVVAAHQQAEEAVSSARKEANILLMNAENKARYIIEEAVNELKGLERDIKAIDKYKETLITQIKGYASDALEKVQRFEERSNPIPFDEKASELKAILDTIPSHKTEEPPVEIQEEVIQETATVDETPADPGKSGDEGSFFDKI